MQALVAAGADLNIQDEVSPMGTLFFFVVLLFVSKPRVCVCVRVRVCMCVFLSPPIYYCYHNDHVDTHYNAVFVFIKSLFYFIFSLFFHSDGGFFNNPRLLRR